MSLTTEGAGSPFQATKLWNQMIRNFREGIELRKRRWKMKMYDKTFCGSDAVDWFLLYLRSNQKFGNHVSRAQAKQLLQKFLENNIFEDARGKEGKSFEDDNHLYRFTEKADQISQNKKEIATQRSVTNLIRSVSIRRDKNPSTSTDSGGTAKVIRNRNLRRVARSQSMKQALMSPRNSLIPRESIGITPLSTNLAHFEIDSTKKSAEQETTVDSLSNVSEVPVSSIDEKENDAFTEQQSELDQSIEDNYSSILQQAGIDNRAFIVEDMSPLVSSFSRTRSLRDPRAMRYRHKFVVNCEDEDSLNEPNLNLHKSIRRSLKRTKSTNLVTGIKFTQTDQCNSPSKKKKIEEESTNVHASSRDSQIGDSTSLSGAISSAESSSSKGMPRSLRPSLSSDSSLSQHKKAILPNRTANSQNKNRKNAYTTSARYTEITWKAETLAGLEKALRVESLDAYVNPTLVTDDEIKTNIDTELKSAEIPEWVLSAMKFLVKWPSKENADDSNLPSYDGFECDVFHAVQDHYQSTLKEPLMTFNLFKLLELASELIVENYARTVLIFQYICLIISPWNRKQIYLLLRFMDKVSRNLELKLDKDIPNKEMALRSFHSIIVRNKEMQSPEKDNMTSLKAVTFMIENHENILKVPLELINKIDQISSQRSRVPTSSIRAPLPKIRERPVSCCMQCSKEEYAKQAEDITRKALADLLNMISNDDTLPPKIKRKRLKGFKKNYPEIYQRKFPEDNISTCSTASQKTLRIRQAIRPMFFNKRHSQL